MSVRFTKLKEEVQGEDGAPAELSNGGHVSADAGSSHEASGGAESEMSSDDEQQVQLLNEADSTHESSFISPWKRRLKRSKLCSLRGKYCRINSWRALVIGVVVFLVAIALAFLISRLASEPPPPIRIGI